LEPRLDISGVTVETLLAALRAVLARAKAMEESVHVVQPRMLTIEEQTARLRESVCDGRTISFHELLSAHPDRIEVTVTLLALLELVKRQEAIAYQPYLFGPIRISSS
jgi:segregation and condensation protein A